MLDLLVHWGGGGGGGGERGREEGGERDPGERAFVLVNCRYLWGCIPVFITGFFITFEVCFYSLMGVSQPLAGNFFS